MSPCRRARPFLSPQRSLALVLALLLVCCLFSIRALVSTKSYFDCLVSYKGEAVIPHSYARYDDSYFFKEMRANIGKYVFKRPKLKEWILSLRRSGINVFLLTNSMLPYTHLLSRYVFGDDWVDVYDLCLFYGRKPHFFLASDPFKEVQFADDGVSDVVVRENVTSLEVACSVISGL